MKNTQSFLRVDGWLAVLGLLAFTLRVITLSRFSSSPDFVPTGDDMKFYHDWALRILGGEWSDGKAFYGLPGYAYALALIYAIAGPSPLAVGLLQCVFEAVSTVVIARLTMEAFSTHTRFARPMAALAAVGWVCFLPAQAFSVILMPTSWVVAAYWILVLWIMKTDVAASWRTWFGMGLLMGVVSMLVATILLLLPLLLFAAWRWRPRRPVLLLGAVALVFAGIFLGNSPAWLHNRLVAREPVLLSAHSGLNFWIGNNPDATGYPKIPSGLRASQEGLLQDSITFAERDAGRNLTRAEVSGHWSAKARAWIASDRAGWLALLGKKFANFWNAFQYDDVAAIPLLRTQDVLLPGLRFGVVAALALPGLIFAAWRVPRARWIAAAVVLHMAALMPVFITERYRLCAVPGLLIFAGYGLISLWEWLLQRRWLEPIAFGGATAGAALFVTLPRTDPGLWSLEHYRTGVRAQRTGDLDTAQRELELAAAYVQSNPEINFALGNLCFARKDSTRAKAFYRRTLELNPAHGDAWNNLGVVALEEKYLDVARGCFIRAIQFDPNDAKTHYLLATVLLESGDLPGARTALGTALKLRPSQPEFLALQARLDSTAPQ